MESFYSVKESFGTSTSSNIGEVTNDQQHEEEEESPSFLPARNTL
jgi:hypothetical protein